MIILEMEQKKFRSFFLRLAGENYFIALGEIYRVVEILKITLKRFSSLLLLSNQNRLNEVNMCLDICTEAWNSGLNVALETISGGNSASALNAKSLAESIKRIREVDIQNDVLYKERAYCKLCLLPLALLPGKQIDLNYEDIYVPTKTFPKLAMKNQN